MGLLRPAWCKLFSVTLLHFPCSTCFGCNIHPSSGASYNVHAAGTCVLYDAPEDGCILHPKHVAQGKCNKVTLNNLHQAGLNKPILFLQVANYHQDDENKECRMVHKSSMHVNIVFVGKHEGMKQFGRSRRRQHIGRLFPACAMKAYEEWRKSSIYS